MDAADPASVGRALCAWASATFGGPVELAEEPEAITGGFDNRIYRLRFAGQLPDGLSEPLIARITQSADRLAIIEREAAIQSWCADRGYPTPRVLAVIAPGPDVSLPVQLIGFAPGRPMLAAILSAPWRARTLVRRLANLHARLHQLAPDGWPLDEDSLALAERRLSLVDEVSVTLGDEPLTAALERVRKQLLPRLVTTHPSVCHGDFHPLNVLVDGDRATVIDWTDAGLGDRHGDIARTGLLFEVASVAATSRVERTVLKIVGPRLARVYRRAYERHLPVDDVQLALWEPLHLLHGWAQVRAATAGVFDQAPDRVQDINPDLGDWLQRRFARRMAELGV